MIQLTAAAAEKVKDFLAREKDGLPRAGLRLYAQDGGCCGLRYGLALDEPQDGDRVFDTAGIRVIVDPASLEHLEESTVDYRDDGEGFVILGAKSAPGRCCGDGGCP